MPNTTWKFIKFPGAKAGVGIRCAARAIGVALRDLILNRVTERLTSVAPVARVRGVIEKLNAQSNYFLRTFYLLRGYLPYFLAALNIARIFSG
jgi:hypothetical protein